MAEISRKSIVYDIIFEVEKGKKSAKQATQELNKMNKSAKGLSSTFAALGPAIAAAFSVQQIIAFTREAVTLSLKMEGVRRAFKSLNDPRLLDNLRAATKGTIDDLTLMQAAVRADKFRIPIQQLATFFKFASIRARETGQSVDFLVNSIVDGIGRKSTLVLDNLGLSAAEIQEEMKKTGDLATAVGNIIERDMGGGTDTAADAVDRFNVAVTNLKLALGDIVIKGAPVLEFLTEFINRTAEANFSTSQFVLNLAKDLLGLNKEVEELNNELRDGVPFFKFASIRARETGQSVDFLVNSIVDGIGRKSTLVLDNLGLSAAEIQEEMKKTGDLATAVGNIIERDMGGGTDTAADAVDRFNVAVTNLKLALGDIVIKGAPVLEFLTEFINRTAEANFSTSQFVLNLAKDLLGLNKEVEELNNELRDGVPFVKAFGSEVETKISKTVNTLKSMGEELKKLKDELDITDTASPEFERLKGEIAELEARIKSFTDNSSENIKEFTETIRLQTGDQTQELKILTDAMESYKESTDFKDITEKGAASLAVLTDAIQGSADALKNAGGEAATFGEIIESNKEAIIGYAEDSLGSLVGLAKEGSNLSIALAGVQIFANQAKAISAAIAAASEASLTQGGLSLPVLIPAFVSIALSTFAQVNGLLNQAKSASAQVQAFAEGEVDISGGKRGKDSIPAMLMPGETVTPTDKTSKYKPILQAIHNDTLDDLIRVNYVEPALVTAGIEQALNDSRQPDYSNRFYRQLLATEGGNKTGKNMVSVLYSIDRKLTTKNSRYGHV